MTCSRCPDPAQYECAENGGKFCEKHIPADEMTYRRIKKT